MPSAKIRTECFGFNAVRQIYDLCFNYFPKTQIVDLAF